MKYIHFDAQGELLGRYDSAIHLQIPAGAVEISDELFLRTIDERDGIWRYTDGKVTKHSLPNASQLVDGERRAAALARVMSCWPKPISKPSAWRTPTSRACSMQTICSDSRHSPPTNWR